jgi:acetoin utilization deacetylase AcuC-like enzyme/GNAT superfamily N-acetyltransferase
MVRRIHDDVLPVNQEALRQVREILRYHFSAVRESELDALPSKLRNPFKERFRSILLVTETRRRIVQGCALMSYDPELRFAFLDYLASAKGLSSRGFGGALYESVREETQALGGTGIFYECLPDDPGQCPDPVMLRENRARLRFYETFGARPLWDNDYQRPIMPGDICLPFLLFDGLDRKVPLPLREARRIVRAILERKYAHLCSPEYVDAVVTSFRDDPVRQRPFTYVKPSDLGVHPRVAQPARPVMVVTDRHDIHHVRERGYVEAPVRISAILAELEASGRFERVPPRPQPRSVIEAVHDREFVTYLEAICAQIQDQSTVYPYVFPIRNRARPPRELSVRAGYYCMDTFTPLNAHAWQAALRAVDCAVTASQHVLDGRRIAYALVRPPGHHAERRVFGGFCYLNNSAIVAHRLSALGRVAVLDVDYHHGNGTQDVFFERRDVLTVSIHGHPDFAYPYFSGFTDELGTGLGEGYNLNLPLEESQTADTYHEALARAVGTIRDFGADFLVVALGLDTAKGDPTGTWSLAAKDLARNGRTIGQLYLPTVVVQEGGYRTRTLGVNARAFLEGLLEGAGIG